MIYSYIRISTDKQSISNQMFEIDNYAIKNSIKIDECVKEVVSGTKSINDRKLGFLLQDMKQNDTLIISEISRLGRNLLQIMSILNLCMERNIKIIAIKEGYEFGDNLNSKVLAFAFGLSAEIERNLISQRTKEALANRKAQGIKLGRPKSNSYSFIKLRGKENDIKKMLTNGCSKAYIMKELNVCRTTLNRFLKQKFNFLLKFLKREYLNKSYI